MARTREGFASIGFGENRGVIGGTLGAGAPCRGRNIRGRFQSFLSRGRGQGSDLTFYQLHSAPGTNAHAFLEGSSSESNLAHRRRAVLIL